MRDPTHELYDRASAVLAAAQGMRAAARTPQPLADTEAALDCVAASLDAIAAALDALGDRAADGLDTAERTAPEHHGRIRAREAHARFDELARRVREPAVISSRRRG
ncbi:MAG: hypothetical protein IRZ32_01640 [Solirubrobacteraceae bacterium]|nr:hypothetical protein [Solirubrobacteraceae bacterium]